MKVSDVINPNAVDLNMDAHNKEEALARLCELLEKDGSVTSAELFKKDVYFRESEGHTGIGDGVAIPHGKSETVLKTCIAIGRCKEPIEWETIDGKPVRVIILFAVSKDDKNNYFVKLMSEVARMLAHPGTAEKLLRCADCGELLAIFDT